MNYSLYKLNFKTAMHMGSSDGGVSLSDGEMIIRSDTIFSALCCEAVKNNKISDLYELYKDGDLVNSDALPFFKEELFLPKPIIYMERKTSKDGPIDNQKKELKKIEYIPFTHFTDYINALDKPSIDTEGLKQSFGQMLVYNRVNIKDDEIPSPYHLAVWRFNDDSGLYIILKHKDDEAKTLFYDLLSNLGLSGIGGKQSSGLGKFQVSQHDLPQALIDLLDNQDARYYMLIGTGLPPDEELDKILEEAWYKLIRRGGFVKSTSYASNQLKKKTIYMLSGGSVFSKRFTGHILDLSHKGAHPVWRCTNTLFVGVNL